MAGRRCQMNVEETLGQNDPVTFHTAYLEDMHQSLTHISYSLWRSRRGGEE